MKISRTRSLLACILLLVSAPVWAVEYSHTSKVAFIYPVSNGDFVVGFQTNSANCPSASVPTKYHYVAVGQNSVNAEGEKKMYAALVLAMSLGLNVSIHFDNGTVSCYINRLSVQADL